MRTLQRASLVCKRRVRVVLVAEDTPPEWSRSHLQTELAIGIGVVRLLPLLQVASDHGSIPCGSHGSGGQPPRGATHVPRDPVSPTRTRILTLKPSHTNPENPKPQTLSPQPQTLNPKLARTPQVELPLPTVPPSMTTTRCPRPAWPCCSTSASATRPSPSVSCVWNHCCTTPSGCQRAAGRAAHGCDEQSKAVKRTAERVAQSTGQENTACCSHIEDKDQQCVSQPH